ncbi:hypothetical protein ACIGD1_11355 [Streptomyces sp. NPDC085612]|uniref:hypothetical protein n=1 Tax=Streptomyces sp. NPDC085612 TaxID=3365732 RepID=UPI0037D117B7
MTHAFDTNPEALAWARAKVQAYLDRLQQFEEQAHVEQDPVTAAACRNARLMAARHFLGDGDRTVGVFDERLASTQPADGEHCVHSRAIHHRHHQQHVEGCPWCKNGTTHHKPGDLL